MNKLMIVVLISIETALCCYTMVVKQSVFGTYFTALAFGLTMGYLMRLGDEETRNNTNKEEENDNNNKAIPGQTE